MGDLKALRAAIAAALCTDGASPGGSATAVATAGAQALPGDGGAVTLMSSDAHRQTLAATDEVITAVEQAQYTVGEGPSLDAVVTGRPVLVDDLSDPWHQATWPGLAGQLADLPVAGLFAFPMRLGATPVGVALCYRRLAGELDAEEVTFALRAANVLTLALLHIREEHAGPDDEQGDWLGDGMPGTRAVHQATGMVMVQLGGVTSPVAFARLRAYAFAHERTLDDVAAAIVARHLVLEPDDGAAT
ncbi:MAG TPA: GAF and ANTAR domain-containing protein [Mycobacteriales bacterium]|nr:GAF and ANTAR domain-containing protein [Mycobacteriales bacterium]